MESGSIIMRANLKTISYAILKGGAKIRVAFISEK
jgi:hypothetical protein